jgi:hypothetical protein
LQSFKSEGIESDRGCNVGRCSCHVGRFADFVDNTNTQE